jgi:C4-dicarboxylate-specific signal transduction histidine kinase
VIWLILAALLLVAEFLLVNLAVLAVLWRRAERRLVVARTVVARADARLNHASGRNADLTRENRRLAAELGDAQERLKFAEIIAGQPSTFFLPSSPQIGDES